MYFPGDFVLAQLDGVVRFAFVVWYDEASYKVLTSHGIVPSKLENAVRAGWHRNAQSYTLVDASSQNVCHHEAYAAFVACAALQSHESPNVQLTLPDLTCKVLTFLDGFKKSIDFQSVLKVATTLQAMLRLAQHQTNRLIDQHIRDALRGQTSFSLPSAMCPDDILLHHANSPSVKAQLYAYYNIDMHALLDEYFSSKLFAQHTIVQLGGFNIRKYTHVDLDGFDHPTTLCQATTMLLKHKNALALVLSNIPACLAWLLEVGFKGKTVVVGRFSSWPSSLKSRILRGSSSRRNLLGDYRVVVLETQAPTACAIHRATHRATNHMSNPPHKQTNKHLTNTTSNTQKVASCK